MNQADENKLATRLHRELRELPPLTAPRTLAPRVMAAIAARQRAPWWRKSWAEWPAGVRMAFLVLSLSFAGALVMVGMQVPQLSDLFGRAGQTMGSWFAGVQPYVEFASRLAEGMSAVVRSAPQHMLWWCAAFIGLAYATCVGLGTLGYRVATNRI